MKQRIALLGAPAAGKGTQAELILSHYGIPVASPGAILRKEKERQTPLGVEASKITNDGRLLPDGIVIGLVRTWLVENSFRFVLDGFPRTIAQAEALDAMLAEAEQPLEAVLVLEISEAELKHRVASRLSCLQCGHIVSVGIHVQSAADLCPHCQGTLARREDDSPETLAARLIQYKEKTEPLMEFYTQRRLLYRVPSGRTPELVFQEISAILEMR